MVGVIFVGASVFSFIAIIKKDEKFEKEVNEYYLFIYWTILVYSYFR